MSNFRLSQAASLVTREIRSANEGYQDMKNFYAPSECGNLIWDGMKKRIVEGLNALGYTPESFVKEATERTSEKFVYFSGLSEVLEFGDTVE